MQAEEDRGLCIRGSCNERGESELQGKPEVR